MASTPGNDLGEHAADGTETAHISAKELRKRTRAWALWDWATQPFNSVILTFVFTALYLVTDTFISPELAALDDKDPLKEQAIAQLASGFGVATTIAGVAIAVLAPVLGQRADAAGKRKRWLLIYTAGLIASMAALFFVKGQPSFFILGISLIALGTIFSELAGVNYNAMLTQVSTPKTVGKVSGLGWGLGYVGGIIALVLVIVAYVSNWFGLPETDGLPFRLVAVGCAVWAVVFCIPFMRNVPEFTAGPRLTGPKPSLWNSYRALFRHVKRLWTGNRPTLWFLLASAVYRDGLAGVFAFGAVIASAVFGFDFMEVVLFGVAANLVAGIATITAGWFDDKFGPRAVILTALVGLLVAGLAVFCFADAGKLVFWVCGLALCAFVGPAQAASRSLLTRMTPIGQEGELFGLYATTGRAVSFLAPGLWTLCIAVFGATVYGVLGIMVVLAVGLALMICVKMPTKN